MADTTSIPAFWLCPAVQADYKSAKSARSAWPNKAVQAISVRFVRFVFKKPAVQADNYLISVTYSVWDWQSPLSPFFPFQPFFIAFYLAVSQKSITFASKNDGEIEQGCNPTIPWYIKDNSSSVICSHRQSLWRTYFPYPLFSRHRWQHIVLRALSGSYAEAYLFIMPSCFPK